MIRLVFLLLLSVFIGGIVHIASLMMIPVLAPQSAYGRIEKILPTNSFATLGVKQGVLPQLDPAFEYRFCKFDLRDGPLRISVPVGETYYSLAFHAHDGGAFYGLNQRSATGGRLDIHLLGPNMPAGNEEEIQPHAIRLMAPTHVGFIVAKAFAGTQSQRAAAQRTVNEAYCGLDGQ